MYRFYKSELRKRMCETLILNGKSESTRLANMRQVRVLSDFYDNSPDQITEDEIRKYYGK